MPSPQPGKFSGFKYNNNGWKYSAATRYALFFLLGLMFYFSMSPDLLPKRYDIKEGALSAKEITAPVQIQDKKATLKAQEEAAESVQPKYQIIPLRAENLITSLLDRIDRLNQDDSISQSDKTAIYREEIPKRASDFILNFVASSRSAGSYSDHLLQEMQTKIKEQTYTIPEETYIKIPRLTSQDIIEMKPVARDIVSKLMNDQIVDADAARAKVAEQVSISSLSQRTAREVVQELARLAITANKFYDEDATKEAEVKARENTPPVYIEQGDVLVAKGEKITPELYKLLDENGLLNNEVNYWPELGLFLLSAILAVGLLMYIRHLDYKGFKYNNAQLLMLLLVFFITIVSLRIIAVLQSDARHFIGYLAPVSVGALLVALLLDVSLAYFCSTLFALIASIVLNVQQNTVFDFNYGFFALVTSYVAVFATHRAGQRSTVLKGGILASLTGALTVFALFLLGNSAWKEMDTLYAVGFALTGGLLTSVLVIGLMPFFETTFGILSALKLVELSNPNHPLLRKLLTETPGTYHHSVMVGNLSEAAAEAIGADGLLCRVGSYYHDIGKTKRPFYFIENQNNMENPHDSIDPSLSKSIIVAHARDGVEMLREYKLPKPIRDIAEQHHGTTFLHYFYHKALRQAEEKGLAPDFTEDDFRYPGPKAQSKEAAVIGIADSVEAAVRSLRSPTVGQVETMIERIIKSRLDDHQFDECDLTLRELDIIAKTLKETVMGIFHSRIEYPEEAKKPKKEEGAAEA
ncbi:HDIG domain-containing protein [Paenibacillus spiritus]|uniref:HDIG domain-containing protein n=1 Tax=Paenibacillus spiritus TaxID=2496557 RepID=A0A5J5GIW6_9BACL|nr:MULTISPECIES: HDIG domain-containing metalloprotein [Paenibacillus]KAA9007648.1 HDIG domain-containing protein [Paenibacillus spiritus]